MSFSVDSLTSKLSALNESQDSIVSVSQWIQFHRRNSGPIARTWHDYLRNIPLKRKLAMVYLANDVVQQSKAKKREDFIDAFSNVIVDGIVSTYREGSTDLRGKIRRVIEVWDQRQVFRRDIIDELNNKMRDLDEGGATGGSIGGSAGTGSGSSSIGGTGLGGLGGIGGTGLGGIGGIGGTGLSGIGGTGLGGIGGTGLSGIGGTGFGDLGGSSSTRPEIKELNSLLGKVKKTTTVTETKSKLESAQKTRDGKALESLLATVTQTIGEIATNQALRQKIDTELLSLKNKQASLLEEDKHNMAVFESIKRDVESAQKDVSSLVGEVTNGADDNDEYVPQSSAPANAPTAPAALLGDDDDTEDAYEPQPAVSDDDNDDYTPQPATAAAANDEDDYVPSAATGADFKPSQFAADTDFSAPQYDDDSDEDSDEPDSKKRKVETAEQKDTA